MRALITQDDVIIRMTEELPARVRCQHAQHFLSVFRFVSDTSVGVPSA